MNDAMPQDDAILPEQFLHDGASRCRTAEHRLMLAVLWDAAYVYGTRKGRRRGARLLREVEEWLRSSDTSYIFSFESICDTLGLNADYFRTRLLRSASSAVAPATTASGYQAMRRAVGQ
jgi:hypothetical protein